PLVQAAVGLYLPDADPAGWETLKPVVRRCHEKKDDRLLLDDSKKVYTHGGLEAIERGVLRLAPWSACVGELVAKACLPTCRTELPAEAWYDSNERLPLVMSRQDLDATWSSLAVPAYPEGGRFAVEMV